MSDLSNPSLSRSPGTFRWAGRKRQGVTSLAQNKGLGEIGRVLVLSLVLLMGAALCGRGRLRNEVPAIGACCGSKGHG
jgi:hypothetical protein